MIRKTLPWLVMLALAFSGCLGIFDDGDGLIDENGGDDGNGDGEEDNDEGNETRDPLTASLEANVTKGMAPLSVSFSFNGTTGEDRPVSWSLSVGDDEIESGETLPGTVEYTFEGAGNYTVVLEVTDGLETAEANVTIEALAEQPPEPVVIEGSAIIGQPLHSVLLCLRDDIDGNIHEIAPAEEGWVFNLNPADAFTLYWFQGDSYMAAGGTSGEVPAGATHAEICMVEGNALDDYELTLWHPNHPDAP